MNKPEMTVVSTPSMSEPVLRVALAQMVSGCSDPDPQTVIAANLAAVRRLVGEAAVRGAQLVILPENLLTFGLRQGFSLSDQQQWLSAFSALARSQGVWLVAGSLPLTLDPLCAADKPPDDTVKPWATCVVFDCDGHTAGYYRKMHLFDASVSDGVGRYRESDSFTAGDQPVVLPTPWGKMGLGICYDLRFPGYFQALADAGAEFVALPSAFTHATGQAHWEILLRARAIENQLFMLGVNQGGEHGSGRVTWGDSMAVNPWGEVIARAQTATHGSTSGNLGEQLVVTDLDLSMTGAIRAKMPVTEHRRLR